MASGYLVGSGAVNFIWEMSLILDFFRASSDLNAALTEEVR